MNLHFARLLFSFAPLVGTAFAQTPVSAAPDPVAIVKRSVEVDNRQEELRRDYTYDQLATTKELDSKGQVKKTTSTKTEVIVIGPQRLRLVVERDGKPLPPGDAAKEKARYEKGAQEAAKMSPAETKKRLDDQRRRSEEEREKFQHIPEAFTFTLMGEQELDGRPAWKIRAMPKRNYSGPYAFLLRNIEGTLWVDKADHAWVKFEADTLGTVSFGWLLARIAKGTRMTFESHKINNELWAPSKITIRGDARIALLKSLRIDQEIAFTRYRKFQTDAHVVATEGPQ